MKSWIRDAAERAVRHEGVDAIILFGSRARGDTHHASDWDLCMVGSHRPERIEEAMGLEDYRYESGRVDIIWQDRNTLCHETSAGTVWAEIVRHGRVLAGDPKILHNIEIKPIKKSDIARAFAITTKKVETAVHHAREASRSSPNRRALAEIEGTEASAFAAEQLSRALVGLLGEQPGGGHDVNTNAKVLQRAAEKTIDSDQAHTLQAVADAIERTNGGTHDARGATYTAKAEQREQWEGRIAQVARTYTEVIEGVMAGTGPLAGLHAIAESGRAREIIANEAEAARETCTAINEAGIRHLRTTTKRALKGWEKQWEAVTKMSAAQHQSWVQTPQGGWVGGFWI